MSLPSVPRAHFGLPATRSLDGAGGGGDCVADADVVLLILVEQIPPLSLMWCSRWSYVADAAVGVADMLLVVVWMLPLPQMCCSWWSCRSRHCC